MRILFFLSLIATLALISFQVSSLAQAADDEPSIAAAAFATNPVDEKLIATMPLRNKIGQLLMFGFMGTDTKETLGKTIERIRPGGIIIFGRNIKSARQISDLNISAQKLSLAYSKVPLMIATDQEGGDVIRIKTHYPLPSALAIGRTDSERLAEITGRATGQLLRVLGFTMNLAPVLDVTDQNQARFVGTRSFGDHPEQVGRMALAYAKGLALSRILPTAKHFPGHGGVDQDSHITTPEKDSSRAELETRDLVPFEYFQAHMDSPWAIMAAHVSYPALDSSRMPATFSKPILTDLLRNQIHFEGLVISDDISMGGAQVAGGIRERAIKAFNSGVDMILIGWNRKSLALVADALYRGVKSGRISKDRVDQSLRRILAAKRAYVHHYLHRPSNEEILVGLQNPAFREIAEATVIARLNLTADPTAQAIQEESAGKSLLVFSSNDRFLESFRSSVKDHSVKNYRLDLQNTVKIDRIMRANPSSFGVLYVSGYKVASLASLIPKDVAKRMFVVTVESPSTMPNASQFLAVSDIYYRHPALGKLIAEHFFAPAVDPDSNRMPANAPSEEK